MLDFDVEKNNTYYDNYHISLTINTSSYWCSKRNTHNGLKRNYKKLSYIG